MEQRIAIAPFRKRQAGREVKTDADAEKLLRGLLSFCEKVKVVDDARLLAVLLTAGTVRRGD